MNLKPRSSLLSFHSSLTWCNVLAPLFVGMLMVMGWTQSQSHHPSRHGGFKPVLWSCKTHSSPWPLVSWPPPDFSPVFLLWLELLQCTWPSAPSTYPLVNICYCVWLVSRLSSNRSHFSHTFLIWFQVALSMPPIRGKSKRCTTWYAARGRRARGHGQQACPSSPPETEFVSTPKPIIAPNPSFTFVLPPRDTTLDLSPLSNPYACRVEWFDSHGNSLGFAPRLNPSTTPPPTTLHLLLHHLHLLSPPPPPFPQLPSPLRPPPLLSLTPPLPPPTLLLLLRSLLLSPATQKGTFSKESLDAIKRGIEDIKGDIN
jgi:hypothetical protein